MSQLTEQVKEMRLCTDVEGGDSTAIVHGSVRIATDACLERIRDEYFILSAQPGDTEYTLILETEPGWILEAVARSAIVGAEQNDVYRVYIEGPAAQFLGKAISVLKKESCYEKIMDIRQKISLLKSESKYLQCEIEELGDEEVRLDAEIAVFEEELAELKQKKKELNSEQDELKCQAKNIEQERRDLKKQKKHIRKHIKNMRATIYSTVVQI